VLPSTEEDRASVRIAVRLALAVLLVEEGAVLESILIDEPFARMEPAARLRTVELLRSLREALPQILLLARGEAPEAAPERFDRIFEFREDRRGVTATLRGLPGGVGTLRIV
jgi:DNA repair exonuclease SbcCD ATPase subunit